MPRGQRASLRLRAPSGLFRLQPKGLPKARCRLEAPSGDPGGDPRKMDEHEDDGYSAGVRIVAHDHARHDLPYQTPHGFENFPVESMRS